MTRSSIIKCFSHFILFLTAIFLAHPVNARSTVKKVHDDRRRIKFDSNFWTNPPGVKNPVFNVSKGRNHDPILFVDQDQEYPYYLLISHTPGELHLWRTKNFSWSSAHWELVSDDYYVFDNYEFDDGVKVDDTYYLFEEGRVFTYSGRLENGSGDWELSGTYPFGLGRDVGVFYEDGIFHIFGEEGGIPNGINGEWLSHFSSKTGLGDWQLENWKALNPNSKGRVKVKVGDPSIEKIEGNYYIFLDHVTKKKSYRIGTWKSEELGGAFEFVDIAIKPRSRSKDEWYNHSTQDPEVDFIPDLSRYVMLVNMKDNDGIPGGKFPNLGQNTTQVVGMFYSRYKNSN